MPFALATTLSLAQMASRMRPGIKRDERRRSYFNKWWHKSNNMCFIYHPSLKISTRSYYVARQLYFIPSSFRTFANVSNNQDVRRTSQQIRTFAERLKQIRTVAERFNNKSGHSPNVSQIMACGEHRGDKVAAELKVNAGACFFFKEAT